MIIHSSMVNWALNGAIQYPLSTTISLAHWETITFSPSFANDDPSSRAIQGHDEFFRRDSTTGRWCRLRRCIRFRCFLLPLRLVRNLSGQQICWNRRIEVYSLHSKPCHHFNLNNSSKLSTRSENFNTAGRNVGTGLTACVICSSWTWAATILQSSNVAYQYGISGPFWYASGATVQILLFGVLAIEVKRKAKNAHTSK